MDVSFERAISLYDFPSGRRLHALSETAAVTKREDFKQLSDLLDDAVPHERSTYKLSAQWRQARLERTPRFGAEAVNLDRRIDSALAAADRVLEGHQAAAESAEADSIEALRDELFPGGVLSSIRLSFIEALAELERILQLIDGKHKARLKELALEWLAVRVRPLYESFPSGSSRTQRSRARLWRTSSRSRQRPELSAACRCLRLWLLQQRQR